MSSRTSSSSSQQQGIDFRDAVAILSARSPHSSSSHEHHHHPTECHHAPISIDMKRMGQVIEVSTDPSSTNNDTKKALEEEQRVHQKKLHTTMSTMSVRELLQTVLEAQQQRVESYRTYNQGLDLMLQSRNVSTYPAVCASATASFCVINETIQEARSLLAKNHYHDDASSWVKLIDVLQRHEKEKLNLTAALHLERIREQQSNDRPITELLQQGIVELRDKISNCVESINEAIDEIRCAMMDETD